MSGVKLEVQWSPVHPEKFITWGTEIFLYEIVSLKDISQPPYIKVSETTGANLLATNSNHHYVKCVDIYPQSESDILLAIGQANGRITLTTFGPTSFDTCGLTGKELAPRHARQCNSIAWNPVEYNLIAAALDKNRADHSVLLWDVFKCPHYVDSKVNASVGSSHHHHSGSSGSEGARPIAELGMSETAHSLAWFSFQPRCLVAGMNNKHLRLFDLRDSSKVINSTPTKAVYGLAVDPYNDYQLASFIENQIFIWDTRNFEKPVLTVTQSKPITKVLWCPTRRNLLGSLLRDSSNIYLHDIRHTVVGNDEVEPSVLERSVQPSPASTITSFSWHPTHENRLMTINFSGMINDYVVFERITLNWSPNSSILWTQGRRFLKYINEKDTFYNSFGDISVKIKRRALNDYGLKPELYENGDLAEDDHLKKVWQWLSLSRSHVEDGRIRGISSRLPGVRCVLKLDSSQQNSSSNMKSEQMSVTWPDLSNPGNGFSAKIYRSEDRDKALQLCGWNFDADCMGLTSFLERLEAEGAHARAAAIAVFNLKLRTAIEILNRGSVSQKGQTSASNLHIVAMALAGFSDDKGSMWRELCLSSRSQLTDPYLRATFAFLTDDDDCYDNVLNESGIAVEDRVAFACTFLSDNRLNEYLNNLMAKLTDEGDLAGMLLTGNSNDSLQMLQSYLEETGDIQSVCLLAVRTFSPELIEGPTVQLWIINYRALLDSWHLWNQRAQFDIMLSAYSASDKPPQQVFVSCNFCGKSISAQMQGHNKNRGTFSRLGTTSQKLKESTFHEAIFDGNRGNYIPSFSNVPHGMSACPQCRKPLPRCAICLMNMGTASGLPNNTSTSTNSNGRHTGDKLAEFSSWFTWCQTCRHGGHAAHVTHWFREHSECPVTGCTCRCLSLDAASKVSSVLSHF